MAYLTGYGRFIAAFVPPPAKNVALRAGQYRVFSDPGGPWRWPGRSSRPRSPTSGRS